MDLCSRHKLTVCIIYCIHKYVELSVYQAFVRKSVSVKLLSLQSVTLRMSYNVHLHHEEAIKVPSPTNWG